MRICESLWRLKTLWIFFYLPAHNGTFFPHKKVCNAFFFLCGIDENDLKPNKRVRNNGKYLLPLLSLVHFTNFFSCHTTRKHMCLGWRSVKYLFIFVILDATIKFTYGMASVTIQVLYCTTQSIVKVFVHHHPHKHLHAVGIEANTKGVAIVT